ERVNFERPFPEQLRGPIHRREEDVLAYQAGTLHDVFSHCDTGRSLLREAGESLCRNPRSLSPQAEASLGPPKQAALEHLSPRFLSLCQRASPAARSEIFPGGPFFRRDARKPLRPLP